MNAEALRTWRLTVERVARQSHELSRDGSARTTNCGDVGPSFPLVLAADDFVIELTHSITFRHNAFCAPLSYLAHEVARAQPKLCAWLLCNRRESRFC